MFTLFIRLSQASFAVGQIEHSFRDDNGKGKGNSKGKRGDAEDAKERGEKQRQMQGSFDCGSHETRAFAQDDRLEERVVGGTTVVNTPIKRYLKCYLDANGDGYQGS